MVKFDKLWIIWMSLEWESMGYIVYFLFSIVVSSPGLTSNIYMRPKS